MRTYSNFQTQCNSIVWFKGVISVFHRMKTFLRFIYSFFIKFHSLDILYKGFLF